MELLYVLLVAIGALLIWRGVTLFLDWRSSLRLRIEPVPPGPDPDVMPSSELGKVRVVHRTEPVMTGPVSAAPAADLQQQIVGGQLPPAIAEASRPDDDLPAHLSGSQGHETEEEPVLLTPASVESVTGFVEQHDMFADMPIAPPPDRRQTASRAKALYGATASVEPVRPVAEPAEKMPLEIEQVIALHVVCRAHPFSGEDLLRNVLSYGLRFGDMSIFHRHEQPSGQGRVLFSMAKAVEPGTFDLEAMTGEEIPGVSFFLGLPGVSSITAYDIMVDTARRLANEMQGDVLDEHQQPLTRQLVEHYRERVQEFERRRLMSRPGQR